MDILSILHRITDFEQNVTQGSHPDSLANNFPSMKHRRFTNRPRTSSVVYSHFKERPIHLAFLVWGRSASVASDPLDITDPRRQSATFEDGIELVDDAEVSVHSATTMALCLTYKGATTIHQRHKLFVHPSFVRAQEVTQKRCLDQCRAIGF